MWVHGICGHCRPSRVYVVVALLNSQCCQITMTIYNYTDTMVTKVYSCNNDVNCMCIPYLNIGLYLCQHSRLSSCRLLRRKDCKSVGSWQKKIKPFKDEQQKVPPETQAPGFPNVVTQKPDREVKLGDWKIIPHKTSCSGLKEKWSPKGTALLGNVDLWE